MVSKFGFLISFCLVLILSVACDGSTQATSSSYGFCTPGQVKLESGVWYSCGGSDWLVDGNKQQQGEEAVVAKLESGQEMAFFSLLTVTAVDPIPGDEIVVFIVGGLTIAAVSVNATQNMDIIAPPIWTGSSSGEYHQWKANVLALSATMQVDQVGVYPIESPVLPEDISYRHALVGTIAVVIEDNPMWASLIVAALDTAGVQVVAVYPSCDEWRLGPVKAAHLYVVDQHSEGANPGYTCIAEIAALLPPPVIIAGFSAEDLDVVTEQWSPGLKSSVRELMEEAGANFVVRKSQTDGILELILSILAGLGV